LLITPIGGIASLVIDDYIGKLHICRSFVDTRKPDTSCLSQRILAFRYSTPSELLRGLSETHPNVVAPLTHTIGYVNDKTCELPVMIQCFKLNHVHTSECIHLTDPSYVEPR
jgi:hypothetical protein